MPRLLLTLAGLALLLPATAAAQVAVRAGTLHTMAGPPITDGVVVIGAACPARRGPPYARP